MLKSDMWREGIRPVSFPARALLLSIAGVIALLFAGVYGIQHPSYAIFAVGAVVMAVVVVARQDELAVVLIVTTHLYLDWYLGYQLIGSLLALGLLLALFLSRSPRSLQYSWTRPRAIWLWALFLGLTIYPTIQGASTLGDALYYYPNIILGAMIFFWLGMVIAQDAIRLQNLFKLLAGLGTLIAVHTLIQVTTGVVLFGTVHVNTYVIQENGSLFGGAIERFGSFFMNPDWSGTFFGVALLLPLGLFVVSTSFLARLVYVVEVFLMAAALLSTYSVGGWVGAIFGFLTFILCVGRWHHRLFICLALALVAGVVVVSFPAQVQLQLQHATNPAELSLRGGAWQTAIRMIEAYPLTGIGLGLNAYLQRSQPYRVLAQFVPLAHPHNSYLELGAMAGLPVLLVFIALLLFALWQAWHNWRQADRHLRTLIACGLACVIALSVNSVSINGWTLPPLAAIGWLILGAITSPLIVQKQLVGTVEEQHSSIHCSE